MITLPPELTSWYFDFDWDIRAVRKLRTPSAEVSVAEIEWQLNYPVWSTRPPLPLCDLRPIDVLRIPSTHEEHYARILTADCLIPIDLLFFRDKWIILDGFHRLAQQKLNGNPYIRARCHPTAVIPNICRENR
jgi:hypothetical protein